MQAPKLTFSPMHKTRLSLVSLLFCTLLALQSCSGKPQYAAIPRGTVVLAFGDSVTHGVGAGQDEDYPTQLAQLTGWDVQNYGISGDTAAAAKGRIAEALEETDPALVIVELGGNDFLRRSPPAQVKEDLREILRAAKAGGRPVVLVAVPEISLFGATVGSLSDAPLYRALATEEQVVLVADVFSEILSTPTLKADRIHPNREGYEVLARGITEVLQDVGLAVKP